MRDVARETIAVTLSHKNQEEAIEVLRQALVSSMRTGDTFVMYLGKMAPDFTNVWNDDKWFPTQKLTNFEKWRQFKIYRDILKPGEDFDILGNKK